VLGRDGAGDAGWVHEHSGGGPRILAAGDALAGEETVDDTVRASAAIGFGGLLLRCPAGGKRSVEQSPEVAALCTSPDPGDRSLALLSLSIWSTEFSSSSSGGRPRALATARCTALHCTALQCERESRLLARVHRSCDVLLSRRA